MPTRIQSTRPETGRPSDPSLAIEVRGLSRHYRHNWTMRVTRGVEDITFDVPRGQVMGYLGPNGAGKTTTIKLLMGLIKRTAGEAFLLGGSIDEPESRRRVGFLPEQPYFYDYLSGLEYLELAGGLSGLGAHEARERGRHWLGRVGLGDRPGLALRKYSKGMLQRLGLAAALLHDPELLILDEPMSGLDPFGRRDVRELILEQKEKGVTVLFSSHILPDVEMLCDRAAIVLHGKIDRLANVGDLLRTGRGSVSVRLGGAHLVALPPAWNGVVERRDRAGELELSVSDPAFVGEVLGWALRSNLQVLAVTPQHASLEELFLAAAAQAQGGSRDVAAGERRSA